VLFVVFIVKDDLSVRFTTSTALLFDTLKHEVNFILLSLLLLLIVVSL
jgi:hypothetical protein